MTAGEQDDALTLVAIGVLVAMVAALAHEALGHGLGCLLDGGGVTLLTFLVFRCAGAGWLADGGGPPGALAVALLALLLFRMLAPRHRLARLFLFNLGILTLLWVCGQTIREGVDGSDDWGHVARDLAWPRWWHVAAATAGILGYAATLRLAVAPARAVAQGRPARLALPWLSALVSAVLLGALWHGDRTASALDGLLSFGVAPLGYLLVVRAVVRQPAAGPPIPRNPALIAAAAIALLLFALTIARGIGPLA